MVSTLSPSSNLIEKFEVLSKYPNRIPLTLAAWNACIINHLSAAVESVVMCIILHILSLQQAMYTHNISHGIHVHCVLPNYLLNELWIPCSYICTQSLMQFVLFGIHKVCLITNNPMCKYVFESMPVFTNSSCCFISSFLQQPYSCVD